jgi:hypothetical protein
MEKNLVEMEMDLVEMDTDPDSFPDSDRQPLDASPYPDPAK